MRALWLPFIIVGSVLTAGSSCAVEIIGHRGASYDAPENTLAAFRLGYQQHADAVELDTYLTPDGRIAVIHDGDTLRIAGISNRVAQTPFEELRKLEAGQWGKWTNKAFAEKIPALEEALAIVPKGRRLFVEIKCGPEILPQLKAVIKRAGKEPAQTVLIGFNYETMRQAKAEFPMLECCWLAGPNKKKEFPPLDELIGKAKAARLDGLDLESGFPIDSAFVAKVHGAGLKLYTWTVDDARVAREQAAAGVDGITTNRPRWLREQLAQP
ncbi:MAG TPA: glycerophosphodiester phosphodiesterase [Verrucomicrobiae bacterium]